MRPGDVVTWTGPTAQGTVTVLLTLTRRCPCCRDWIATEPNGREILVPENELDAPTTGATHMDDIRKANLGDTITIRKPSDSPTPRA